MGLVDESLEGAGLRSIARTAFADSAEDTREGDFLSLFGERSRMPGGGPADGIMTEPSDAEQFRSIVVFQLTLLDLYESLLEMSAWDEEKINTTLKTFMASLLALLRVQRSLGTQAVVGQRELIREHRARLEQWLEEHGETAGNGTGWNGFRAE